MGLLYIICAIESKIQPSCLLKESLNLKSLPNFKQTDKKDIEFKKQPGFIEIFNYK